MDLKELITKTEVQRSAVLELIQKAETTEECFTELAVERFLKGFLFDLKAMAKKPDASENTLPIQNVSKRFKITAVRHDEMDAFGAYACTSIDSEDGGLVLLNVEGSIETCIEHDIEPKQIIIETLMHEFGHALEEWYECDFDEDRMDRIIDSYRRKNGW